MPTIEDIVECSFAQVRWTTESELLFLTKSGLFGLPCLGTSQTISRSKVHKHCRYARACARAHPTCSVRLPQVPFVRTLMVVHARACGGCGDRTQASSSDAGFIYSLSNDIVYDGGYVRVGSSCDPAAQGGRVNFRFASCALKWRSLQV